MDEQAAKAVQLSAARRRARLRRIAVAGFAVVIVLAGVGMSNPWLWPFSRYAEAHRVAQIEAAVRSTHALRAMLLNYYVEKGEFPAHVEEIGAWLVRMPSLATESVVLWPSGVLQLTLRPALFGAAPETLYLVPADLPEWDCVSPDIRSAAGATRCRYVAGYQPPVHEPREAPRPPNAIVLTRTDGQTVTALTYWDLLRRGGFDLLTDTDRKRVIGGALHEQATRLESLADTYRFAWLLHDAGPLAAAALDAAARDDAPPRAAAALWAVCLLEAGRATANSAAHQPIDNGDARAIDRCIAERHASAAPAIARLSELVAQIQPNSMRPGVTAAAQYTGNAGLEDSIALAGALGPSAIASAPALASWLEPNAHVDRQAMPPAHRVAVALLQIHAPAAGAKPDEAFEHALLALIDSQLAVDTAATAAQVIPATLTDATTQAVTSPRVLRALRDRVRLAIDACRVPAESALTALGGVGFHVARKWLERADRQCASNTELTVALRQQMIASPPEVHRLFQTSTSTLLRDHLIEAAEQLLLQAPSASSREGARVARAIVNTVPKWSIVDGSPAFEASKHRWRELSEEQIDERRVVSRERIARDFAAFAASIPECDVRVTDPAQLDIVRARKTVFMFRCEYNNSHLVVVGSPAGFRRMHLPARVHALAADGATALRAVSDVDADGNIEIVVRFAAPNCSGSHCDPIGEWHYHLLEENGDWFTYFR